MFMFIVDIFYPKIVSYAKAGYDKLIYVHSYLTRINPNSWSKTLTELCDFVILKDCMKILECSWVTYL